MLGGKGFVSQAAYPAVKKGYIDESAEMAEELVRGAIADVSEILKVTQIKPKRLVMYTSPEWKINVQAHAVEKGKSADVDETIKWAMAQPDLKQFAKEIPKFATKIVTDVKKLGDEGIAKLGKRIDELSALKDATQMLARKFECHVDIFSADDKGAYDPQGKSKNAAPGRPAIYIE